MAPDIQKMHKVWNDILVADRLPVKRHDYNFDEIVSEVFTLGPSYFYTVDFCDLSIDNLSANFSAIHGLDPDEVQHINDILALIHPDDMDFVSQAEKTGIDFFYKTLEPELLLKYKFSYNFRFRTADGSYRMFNHQSLVLAIDEHRNFIKSLNIHTDISHFSNPGSGTLSLLGLAGEPSYMNMQVGAACMDNAGVSPAELRVLKLVAEGLSSREIAEQLFLSIHTVRTHRKNLMEKFGCRSSPALVRIAMAEGWL